MGVVHVRHARDLARFVELVASSSLPEDRKAELILGQGVKLEPQRKEGRAGPIVRGGLDRLPDFVGVFQHRGRARQFFVATRIHEELGFQVSNRTCI